MATFKSSHESRAWSVSYTTGSSPILRNVRLIHFVVSFPAMTYVPNGILKSENHRELPFWRTYCIKSEELMSLRSERSSTLSRRYFPSGTRLPDEHAMMTSVDRHKRNGAATLCNLENNMDNLYDLMRKLCRRDTEEDPPSSCRMQLTHAKLLKN